MKMLEESGPLVNVESTGIYKISFTVKKVIHVML